MPNNDIVTEEDTKQILRGLMRMSGDDGVEREELFRRAELVTNHIREMKVSAALYETFTSGDVLLDVNESGELICYSAKHYPA